MSEPPASEVHAERTGAVVVTIATQSRFAHLARQREALSRWAPGVRQLLVLMDDSAPEHPWAVHVAPEDGGRLPLARARNAGAAEALEAGAETLIFLDVDCIPGPSLVSGYADAVRSEDSLTCGMVTYLPPAPPDGYDLDALVSAPHGARPSLPAGSSRPARHDEYRLFWSLSFALSANRWRQTGGFYEGYRGYGGEDTDFAYTARDRGIPMRWIGGADAFHQHHAVDDPPWQHLTDIVANARVFHQRWGSWPMEGWLRAFAAAGAVRWSDDELVIIG